MEQNNSNLSLQRFDKQVIQDCTTLELWQLASRRLDFNSEIKTELPTIDQVMALVWLCDLDVLTERIDCERVWVVATAFSCTTYCHTDLTRAVLGCYLMSNHGL